MNLLSRLKKEVVVDAQTKCWNFRSQLKRPHMVWNKGKPIPTTRAVLIEFSGQDKKGLCCCHSCDNPWCINPKHLWWGTRQENSADMGRKGRASRTLYPEKTRGEKHWKAKLTKRDIIFIRREFVRGTRWAPGNRASLAKQFSISESHVRTIACGATWKHI